MCVRTGVRQASLSCSTQSIQKAEFGAGQVLWGHSELCHNILLVHMRSGLGGWAGLGHSTTQLVWELGLGQDWPWGPPTGTCVGWCRWQATQGRFLRDFSNWTAVLKPNHRGNHRHVVQTRAHVTELGFHGFWLPARIKNILRCT